MIKDDTEDQNTSLPDFTRNQMKTKHESTNRQPQSTRNNETKTVIISVMQYVLFPI